LVTEKRWKDIASAYIREHFDRNAFWTIQKHPKLARYDHDVHIDATRNAVTFEAIQVSLKLLIFHVYFLENIGRPGALSLEDIAAKYDKLYGFPTPAMKEDLQKMIKETLALESWEYVKDMSDGITKKPLNLQ
jgi:hypothetical protein